MNSRHILAQSGLGQFKLEFGNQVANLLTAGLTIDLPPIVKQSPPMLDGVRMHWTAPPAAGACNGGDEICTNAPFNSHPLFSRPS
jgi:hypothetical protein